MDRVTYNGTICIVVSSRHRPKGGPSLNEIELMNGCLVKAHANMYIPSTLTVSHYDMNGLNKGKLSINLGIATDVYIDRVNGASCCRQT